MSSFDFKEQLEIGSQGENLLLDVYPEKLIIHPGRDGDFIDSKGRKIELKTDTYCMTKTPNFFIERYSDYHRKTPGSLWQANEHGCNIFVYMFTQNRTYFRFKDIPATIARLEEWLGDQPSYVFVKNRAWITAGCKVPRDVLAGHYDEFNWE